MSADGARNLEHGGDLVELGLRTGPLFFFYFNILKIVSLSLGAPGAPASKERIDAAKHG